MTTAEFQKTLNPNGMRELERAFEELREEFEEHNRYAKAFLSTRTEKSFSLKHLAKKHGLKLPRF